MSDAEPVLVHDNRFLWSGAAPSAPTPAPAAPRFAMIILDGELSPLALALWERAALRMCADGGANRLLDTARASRGSGATGLAAGAEESEGKAAGSAPATGDPAASVPAPHVILGDFDSARREVLEHYKARGSQLTHVSEQDSTDLDKCLRFVADGNRAAAGSREPEIELVLLCGTFGGRLDHQLAILSSLHAFARSFRRLMMLSVENLAEVLVPGSHRLVTCAQLEGPTCGLIPCAGECLSVTTSGLRWNLQAQRMAMGELISTSNRLEAPEVAVRTSHALLWTTALSQPLKTW
jgi:thiamine pyrophosphokinase